MKPDDRTVGPPHIPVSWLEAYLQGWLTKIDGELAQIRKQLHDQRAIEGDAQAEPPDPCEQIPHTVAWTRLRASQMVLERERGQLIATWPVGVPKPSGE